MTCSECGKAFQPRSSNQKTCGLVCRNKQTLARQRRWAAVHVDSRRMSEKKYRDNNREAVRERARAYYAANRIRIIELGRVSAITYKIVNRDKINADRRTYYVLNRDERIAYARVYRKQNRDKKRAWTAQYQRLNRSFPGITQETLANLKKQKQQR